MKESSLAPDVLRKASQLVASAFLRDSSQRSAPFVSKAWRDGWQHLQDEHFCEAIPFSTASPLLDGLLPQLQVSPPQLRRHRDVIWRRGQAGLFSTASGLLLEDTYPFLYQRKRQCPTLVNSKLELTCSASEMPSLERVIYCPSLACGSLHAWITQSLPYVWPWFDHPQSLDLGIRVVIGTADKADDAWLSQVTTRVRSAHGFFCLSEHLPASLHLDDVLVPTPTYSFEAGFSDRYLDCLDTWCDQYLGTPDSNTGAQCRDKRVLIKLDPKPRQDSDLASNIERILVEAGWTSRDLSRDGLIACLNALARAEQVVTFDPLLAWLCRTDSNQQLLILASQPPGLDVFQMIRCRKLQGHWLSLMPYQLNTDATEAVVQEIMTIIKTSFI